MNFAKGYFSVTGPTLLQKALPHRAGRYASERRKKSVERREKTGGAIGDIVDDSTRRQLVIILCFILLHTH
jgi:hypothetical protein